MNSAWNIGYLVGVLKKLYAPLVTILCLWLAYVVTLREPVKVVPTTYFVDDRGNVKMARCDPESPLNQIIVERLVEDLGRVVFEYRRDHFQIYAAQYTSFKPFIDDKSPDTAARLYAEVLDRIGGKERTGIVSRESSQFSLKRDDENKPIFRITRVGEGRWQVYAIGTRSYKNDKGNDLQTIELYVTVREGDHNALYKVSDYRFDIAKL